MNERARIIADRFGAAAGTYDAAAHVQAVAAQRLAARLSAVFPRGPERILEFGCGTGLLTSHLRRIWPRSRIVFSDLAPAMVRRCREQHRGTAIVMDAERPCFADGTFDLICGSLAAQWFADPRASIRGLQCLAAPGGALALTTLGPATLGEWGTARRAAGLAAVGLDYPALGDLAAIREEGMETCLADREMLRDPMPDALAFLGGLRAIGADIGNAAGSAGALRRAIRTLDRHVDAITYELLTLIWQRTPEDGVQR